MPSSDIDQLYIYSLSFKTSSSFLSHYILIKIFPSVAFLTDHSRPSSSCSKGISLNVLELSSLIKFWLYSDLIFSFTSVVAFPNHQVIKWNPVMLTPEKRTILFVIEMGSLTKTPYMKYLDPGTERRSIRALVTLPPPNAS